MKKIVSVIGVALMALLLLSGCTQEAAPAMAQVTEPETVDAVPKTVTGRAEAVNSYPVTAPFGGILLTFDVRKGDPVGENDVLFTIDTTKVYAPCNGTVRGIQASQGDSSESVQARYGALCYIEPENMMIVRASASGAYERSENKIIHAGETLYVKSRNNTRITGSGTVISVNGSEYDIELKSGTLEMDEPVYLYRESDYRTESRVGKGTVARSNPVPVNSQGSVVSVHVSEGQRIGKGELLFEVAYGNTDSNVKDNAIRAPRKSVVGDVAVSAGQSLQRGQFLASIYDPSGMQVIASVDEMDLSGLSQGDKVSIVFDSFPDKAYEGTIEAISGLGEQKQNASYYEIRVSFTPDTGIKLGMSATVYLPVP